jgi:hypothetical protein
MRIKLFQLIIIIIPLFAFSQKSIPVQKVMADLNSGIIESPLPFHEPFIITGKIDEKIVTVQVSIKYSDDQELFRGKWNRISGIPTSDQFAIACDKILESNEDYKFQFMVTRKPTDEELAAFRSSVKIKLKEALLNGLADSFCNKNTLNTGELSTFQNAIRDAMNINLKGESIRWPEKGLLSLNIDLKDQKACYEYIKDADGLFESFCERDQIIDNVQHYVTFLDGTLKSAFQSSVINELHQYFLQDLKVGKWDYVEMRKSTGLLIFLSAKSDNDIYYTVGGIEPLVASAPFLETKPSEELKGIWDAIILQNRIKYLQSSKSTLDKLIEFLTQLKVYSLADVEFAKKNYNYSVLESSLKSARDQFVAISLYIEQISQLLKKHEDALDEFAKKLSLDASISVIVEGSTKVQDIETKARSYIGLDFGLIYSPWLKGNEILPVYGVNFYLVPVNKRVSLCKSLRNQENGLKKFSASRFARSFSISTGFSFVDIKVDNERKGLYENTSFLVGIGWRINRAIRISGGTILFQKKDPNPLINSYNIAATGYFSVSADVDVFGALGKLGDKIFPNLKD